jgi:hypothetical protein
MLEMYKFGEVLLVKWILYVHTHTLFSHSEIIFNDKE